MHLQSCAAYKNEEGIISKWIRNETHLYIYELKES